jgi:hypothetical protein
VNRHAQVADMSVCTGREIGATREQRSSQVCPGDVLSKCESSLNGGFEYEGL